MQAQHNYLWIYSSLVASLCFAGCSLTMGYLSRQQVDAGLIVGGMFAWGSVLGLPPAVRAIRKYPLSLRRGILWATLLGVSAYLGNFLQVQSLYLATNPGYPSAIIGTQIVSVTILAAICFRSPINLREILGISCCLAGLALVVA